MDKIIAAIKFCTEFLLASNLLFQVTKVDAPIRDIVPFLWKYFFFMIAFELAFYWHIVLG
ncbi:MAG: hypothetical protein IT346_04815 [Epsilonproteobacteria bacterium]|nr:hypothetical protein [Campylobacterota bacterium]